MSLFERKGIPLASGFDLQAESHLDSRSGVADTAERDRLVSESAAPKGLITFVNADGQWQGWTGSEWRTLGERGESAYEVAKRLGYEGTEEEWVAEMTVTALTTAEIDDAIAEAETEYNENN